MVKINRALLSSSLILLITFNLYNFLNFVFQFFMARMLTLADYGSLAALFSIIYLTGIFSESIQTIVVKYSASEENKSKLKNLIVRSMRKSFRISAIIFIFYLLIAIPLSFILEIPYLLLTSTGLIIFTSFLSPITRGIMQGTKRFNSLGINMIIESTFKLILAILFVYAGWRVYGAIIATIIATALSFVLSLFAIRDILRLKDKFMPVKEIYAYSKPVFFILFIILAFYSIDVVIAKVVFPAAVAGHYAIASILGKIILFGTQPISKAMFPLSAEKRNQKNNNLILNAFAIIMFCIISILLVIYFFPDAIIKIFAGRAIIESSNILFYLSIAFSLISITSLVLFYRLSRGKISNYWLFAAFPVIEIILLSVFSHNLVEYSLAFVTSSAIFLWGTILLSK